MASTNQSPEYIAAERKYLLAVNDEEKLQLLEEMIRYCPKHKAGQAMRANLKTRYLKLKEKIESKAKLRKSSSKQSTIRKAELQAVLIGLTNSGKSSLLSTLTNAKSEISPYQFTTKKPVIGTLDYDNVKIQLIDLPAINSEYFDSGISNTADVLLIIITNIEDLQIIKPSISRAIGKQLIIFNKIDTLSPEEKRKIEARLKSNKLEFIMFSSKTLENIKELKEKIFQKFDKIRVYTKEPGKPVDSNPVILNQQSTIKDLAEKIFHGLSEKVKEARVTGPSSKFSNQKIGLSHVLKDKDIVEFKT